MFLEYDSTNLKAVQTFLNECKTKLNNFLGATPSKELQVCTKIHLLRKIKHETSIFISPADTNKLIDNACKFLLTKEEIINGGK